MPLPYRRGAERIIKRLNGRHTFGGTLPNDGYIAGIAKCILLDVNNVNSVGVGPDTLHTYTLPAGSLRSNGDFLEVWYSGVFSNGNDRDKSVNAEFDTAVYENGGILDIDNSTGWYINSRIIRFSSIQVRISHVLLENQVAIDSANAVNSFTLGFNEVCRNNIFTISNMDTTDIVMRVRSLVGVGAAAVDVSQNQSIIKLTRF